MVCTLSQDFQCTPCASSNPGCTHPGAATQEWCNGRCSEGVNGEVCSVGFCYCTGSETLTTSGIGSPPCVPCTATDPGCTHPDHASQEWCDERCADGLNDKICDVGFCLCSNSIEDITTTSAEEYHSRCYIADCGCPPFQAEWCSEDSFSPDWCSESESNCLVCGGFFSDTCLEGGPLKITTKVTVTLTSHSECGPLKEELIQIFRSTLGSSAREIVARWSINGFCSSGGSTSSNTGRRRLPTNQDTCTVETDCTTQTCLDQTNNGDLNDAIDHNPGSQFDVASQAAYMTEDNVLYRMKSQGKPFGEHIVNKEEGNLEIITSIFPESKFDTFFPYRNEAYKYKHFLEAAAYWPDFCADQESCPIELAALFAHFVKETGYNQEQNIIDEVNTYELPKWRQGLHYKHEAGCEGGGEGSWSDCKSYNSYKGASTYYPVVEGRWYYGRGALQLSWNFNYGPTSYLLTGDKMTFLKDPDMIVEPEYIFASALWFWMTPQQPKPSMHDLICNYWSPNEFDKTQNPPRVIDGIAQRFSRTIEIINGEQECFYDTSDASAKPEGAEQRYGFFTEFMNAFNQNFVELWVDVDCKNTVPMADAHDTNSGADTLAGARFNLYYTPNVWGNCGCILAWWQTPYVRAFDMLDECEMAHPDMECKTCGSSNLPVENNGWLREPNCSPASSGCNKRFVPVEALLCPVDDDLSSVLECESSDWNNLEIRIGAMCTRETGPGNCGSHHIYQYREDCSPRCTRQWVPIDSDECPSNDGVDLEDCCTTMALGGLCNAQSTLPNSCDCSDSYAIENCGTNSIYRAGCKLPSPCDMSPCMDATGCSNEAQYIAMCGSESNVGFTDIGPLASLTSETIIVFPPGTHNLEIILTSNDGDLDLKLESFEQENIENYLWVEDMNTQTVSTGMSIFFSGDDTTVPLSETIRIDSTTEWIRVVVFNLDTSAETMGRIKYSYSSIQECDDSQVIAPRKCHCGLGFHYAEGEGCQEIAAAAAAEELGPRDKQESFNDEFQPVFCRASGIQTRDFDEDTREGEIEETKDLFSFENGEGTFRVETYQKPEISIDLHHSYMSALFNDNQHLWTRITLASHVQGLDWIVGSQQATKLVMLKIQLTGKDQYDHVKTIKTNDPDPLCLSPSTFGAQCFDGEIPSDDYTLNLITRFGTGFADSGLQTYKQVKITITSESGESEILFGDTAPSAQGNWGVEHLGSDAKTFWPTSLFPYSFDWRVTHNEFPTVMVFVSDASSGDGQWQVGVRFSGDREDATGECSSPSRRRLRGIGEEQVAPCKKSRRCCMPLLGSTENPTVFEECVVGFASDCCAEFSADESTCCGPALRGVSISCADTGCSPGEHCMEDTGFCVTETFSPTMSPIVTRDICEHSFTNHWGYEQGLPYGGTIFVDFGVRHYTIFSPRLHDVDPWEFCLERNLELATFFRPAHYNQFTTGHTLNIWTDDDGPTCSGSGSPGLVIYQPKMYGGYPGCYLMGDGNQWEKYVQAEERMENQHNYGILCQKVVDYQVCQTDIASINGRSFAVFSPRVKHIDVNAFCEERNMHFPELDLYTFNAIRDSDELKLWGKHDSPTCMEDYQQHLMVKYRGADDSKCYALSGASNFPNDYPCHWTDEDSGVLCEY